MLTKSRKPLGRSPKHSNTRRQLFVPSSRLMIDLRSVAAVEQRGKRVLFALRAGQVITSKHITREAAREVFVSACRMLNGLPSLI